MTDGLILVDAYSQIFRAFYAIRQLSSSKGEPTNAVLVFARLLLWIQRNCPGRLGAMLFDCGRVAFRTELCPEYKANRPPMPDALRVQIPIIRELAEAFGWTLLEEPGYEADDLAAGFSQAVAGSVWIVSSDKDLAQLVDDRIKLLMPASKGSGFDEYGVAEITGKYQVPPSMLVDYLALLGDSADNIAGVPGIGAKGAAQLLNTYGSAEEWMDHPEKLAGSKFAGKLEGTLDILKRNRDLIRLRRDLPERFREVDTVLTRRAPDWAKITEICRRLELRSILKELPPVAKDNEVEPEPQGGNNTDQGELF